MSQTTQISTNTPSIQYSYKASCSFQYTEQPPHTLTCNPYTNETLAVNLRCTVKKQDGDLCCIIAWFSESAGTVRPLGLGHSSTKTTTTASSSLVITHSLGNEFCNKIGNGSSFWCQVVNTTGGVYQPLMTSNVFQLKAPEDYTNQPCTSGSAMETTNVCADLPASSPTTSATEEEFPSPSLSIALGTPENVDITSQTGVGACSTETYTTTVFVLPLQSGELLR